MEANLADFLVQFLAVASIGGAAFMIYRLNCGEEHTEKEAE